MADPRIEAYAHLLVERCVAVKPGWQVLVQSTPLARPLVEEVVRVIAQRGAYVAVRANYPSIGMVWAREAPEALLAEQIRRRAEELGLTVLEIDGTRSLDDVISRVEAQFAPFLPAGKDSASNGSAQ